MKLIHVTTLIFLLKIFYNQYSLKQFLILNAFVTAIYTIGVLCALLAGAYLPQYRATAIQLSGIVNGIATSI